MALADISMWLVQLAIIMGTGAKFNLGGVVPAQHLLALYYNKSNILLIIINTLITIAYIASHK